MNKLAASSALVVVSAVSLFACGGGEPRPTTPSSGAAEVAPASSAALPATSSSTAAASPAAPAGAAPERTLEGGLKLTDLTVGNGKEVKAGDKIVVHYTGTLEDGYVFDSSHKRNKPFEVTIGAGQVIKGWDRGIVGMKEGGKRKLVVPPALAYGDQNRGSIPPNSTLTFEVDLLQVK